MGLHVSVSALVDIIKLNVASTVQGSDGFSTVPFSYSYKYNTGDALLNVTWKGVLIMQTSASTITHHKTLLLLYICHTYLLQEVSICFPFCFTIYI